MYEAKKYADNNYDGSLKSASKRAGGDGEKLHKYNKENKRKRVVIENSYPRE